MKLVTLVAGQTCTIRCDGVLRLKLYTGNAEIAGVPVEVNRVLTFALRRTRGLLIYTLEGCVLGLQPDCIGDSHLTTELSKFSAGTLLKHIRKGFDTSHNANGAGLMGASSKGGPRIVVAGERGTGRFMTACTIANAINLSGKHEGVIFCDLTASMDGQMSRMGSLGCIETHPEVPLWEGMQWSTYTVSMMFFHGMPTTVVTAPYLQQYLVAAGSACQAALWMSKQKRDCPIVYVLPTFDNLAIADEVFYRAILEPIKPTHIVFTGDEVGSTHQTLGRLAPASKLLYCGVVAVKGGDSESDVAREPVNPSAAALEEYFKGTELTPLGGSLLTVQLSAVRLLTIVSEGTQVEARSYAGPSSSPDDDAPTVSSSLRCLEGTAVVIPNTNVQSEVPFANIAGYVIITRVLAELDQLEVMSPSSDAALPSNLLIVPDNGMLRADPSLLEESCL